MSTYLVTGVAGFIGSKTVELLLNAGHIVVGIDSLNNYYDVRLKKHRLAQLESRENYIFNKLNIESAEEIDALFVKFSFDGVINLAAYSGFPYSLVNPQVYFSTNVNGTLNLLESMRHHQVSKLVIASSSSVYGGLELPFHESLPVNKPISPYAASKKAAEVLCHSYHELFGIDTSILRFFTVFGPCGRPDMCIFRFIKWIAEGDSIKLSGDGSQSRDFTYLDDIVRGILAALKPVGYEIINLGGGKNPVSLNQIIQWIEESLGKKAIIENKPFHKADMTSTWADITKAEKLLGWKPEMDIKEGVERCVHWYQQNQSWLKDIQL